MTEPKKGPEESLEYRRCRFTAKIPGDRLYTRDHYWMRQESPGLWRVGLTPWAVRMLGDFVEYRFDVADGATVQLHQSLGTLEAFKALVEIRALAAGTFVAANPILAGNLDAIARDCYGTGWLYLIQGAPEPDRCDAAHYQLLLDEAIDAMRDAGPTDPR